MAIGIVALVDLDRHWDPANCITPQFVAAAGLAPEGEPRQSFEPPTVVIAICGIVDERFAVVRGWLSRARHVILVWDLHSPDAAADAEFIELIEVPPHIQTFMWRTPADLAPILARALELDEPEPVRATPVFVAREQPATTWIPFADERSLRSVSQHLDDLDWSGAPVSLPGCPPWGLAGTW